MLLFELDFEEVSKKKLRECWSQLCRIRCSLSYLEKAGQLRVISSVPQLASRFVKPGRRDGSVFTFCCCLVEHGLILPSQCFHYNS